MRECWYPSAHRRWLALAAGFLAAGQESTQLPVHPLDHLTAPEIELAREILDQTGLLGPQVRFAYVGLREPPKSAVQQQVSSGVFRRNVEILLFDWATSTPLRAQIDLGRRKLIGWDTLPSREPPTRVLIRRRLEEVVRKDPRWRETLLRRGLSDPGRISVLPGLGESAPLPSVREHRVIRGFPYDQEALHGESRVNGISMVVDLTSGTLLSYRDSLPGSSPSLSRPTLPPTRPGPVPTASRAQPAGAGLMIRGSEIRWGQWKLHAGVHPRRGLELWGVNWIDREGRERAILYRASVSELMAVYGEPGRTWYPRDAGDAGLGSYQENSAIEGIDAPKGARYLAAVFADDQGRPVVIPRAGAIYLREVGPVWRHAGRARPGVQLVLTAHSIIDNYDFVFDWVLGQDGSIEVEVRFTGVVLHRGGATREGLPPMIHQHFISYRLDFDVDGALPNQVVEVEAQPVPRSPTGLQFASRERALVTERAARRSMNAQGSRRWKVINPAVRSAGGVPSGFALLPGENVFPLASPSSPARRQAGFINHHLWVTRWNREEMHAAGEFQNFGLRDEGLPRWTAGDEELMDTDVVVWYTLGTTHIVRPEDDPVMPAFRLGFRLLPSGFFPRNPALDP